MINSMESQQQQSGVGALGEPDVLNLLKTVATHLDLIAQTLARTEQHLAAIALHFPPKEPTTGILDYYKAEAEAKRQG